jgi:hypothetical protein
MGNFKAYIKVFYAIVSIMIVAGNLNIELLDDLGLL